MKEEKGLSTDDKNNRSVIPPQSTSEYVDEVEYEHPGVVSAKLNPISLQSSIPGNRQEKLKLRRLPYLEIGTFLINAFLAYYTYQLFKETQKSTRAAVDSATEAKRSNDMTSKAMLENAKREQVIDSLDSTIRLQESAFRTNSESRANKEFTVTNQPYVILDTFQVNAWWAGERLNISISFRNLGKSPAYLKLFRRNIKLIEGDIKSFSDSVMNYEHSDSANVVTFLGSMQEKKMFAESESVINMDQFNKLSNRTLAIWLYGDVQYDNIITRKRNSSRFSVVIFCDGTFAYTNQHNDIKTLSN